MSGNKLHVLMILRGLDIGNIDGGRELHSIRICLNLNKELFDVSICVFWHDGSDIESYWHKTLLANNIPVFFAVESGRKGHFLRSIQGIYRAIRHYANSKINIVHSQYQLGTIIGIIFKILNFSHFTVRTLHASSLEPGEWGKGLSGWFRQQLFTNGLFPSMLDVEIGISQGAVRSLKKRFLSRILNQQIVLIETGINAPEHQLDQEESEPVSLPASKFVIGSIGRLTKQKGYLYLIEAMPRIVNELPNVILILIGDGELRERLEKRVMDLGIQSNVLFLGQKINIIPFLKKMNLFVLPSLWEGLSAVVLESMACGVPVIATDISGMRELIQQEVTGWLVTPANSTSLADTILKAFRNPSLRAEIAEHAHETAAKFSIKSAALKHEKLYNELSINLKLKA